MLGSIIKDHIDEKGLKQIRIAEKIGIPASTFNDMLNNYKRIDAIVYFKICKALEVSTDYFYKKLEEMDLVS